MTLQDLIKAVEKAKMQTSAWSVGDGCPIFPNLIDADILLAELKKMEE